MGNLADSEEMPYVNKNSKAKLCSTLKISKQQQQHMEFLIKSRSKIRSDYICSAHQFKITNPQDFNSNLLCEQYRQLHIYYEDFDFYLDDLKKQYPLKQFDVQNIILSVCQALVFLMESQLKTRHGDVSPNMICKKANSWKLIDNYFIRQGITAYEKVLLGQHAFISPSQMDKIRHGFVRQSPPITQEDDIFALGMTCLQIMSGRPSKFCYKQTYIRFNDKQIQERIEKISQAYDPNLVHLIRRMIHIEQESRAKIKQILQHQNIIRHNRKVSLRNYGK